MGTALLARHRPPPRIYKNSWCLLPQKTTLSTLHNVFWVLLRLTKEAVPRLDGSLAFMHLLRGSQLEVEFSCPAGRLEGLGTGRLSTETHPLSYTAAQTQQSNQMLQISMHAIQCSQVVVELVLKWNCPLIQYPNHM
jgi:hypothetical protein